MQWFVLHDNLAPDTAVQLGQLIGNPRRPSDRIGNTPLPLEAEASERVVNKILYRVDDGNVTKIGFSASVLSLLPFELSGERKHHTTHEYEIERVEEKTIHPSLDYVKKSVFEPEVLSYLASTLYRKPLYMVVGVRVAYDAKITHTEQRERAGEIKATVPGSLVGIPLDLGAETRFGNDRGFTQQMHMSYAFVFAYRLRRIRYSRSHATARASDYSKGNLYQVGGPDPTARKQADSENVTNNVYKGVEDEIERVSIQDFDFEEDEADTRVIDGCIIVGDSPK